MGLVYLPTCSTTVLGATAHCQLHQVTYLKPCLTQSLITEHLLHSIPGAVQGAAGSGEHCTPPQLFAGEGEGHKDLVWTVRKGCSWGLGAP